MLGNAFYMTKRLSFPISLWPPSNQTYSGLNKKKPHVQSKRKPHSSSQTSGHLTSSLAESLRPRRHTNHTVALGITSYTSSCTSNTFFNIYRCQKEQLQNHNSTFIKIIFFTKCEYQLRMFRLRCILTNDIKCSCTKVTLVYLHNEKVPCYVYE